MNINQKRVRKLNSFETKTGPVVYWMNRDQRVNDNWSLLFAADLAKRQGEKLVVVFCLRKNFAFATERLVEFMLGGLREVEKDLQSLGVAFELLLGDPKKLLPKFLKTEKAGALVTDFNPLRYKQEWNGYILKKIDIPFFEVDSHNIVSVWEASPKQEFGAYTLRPKLHKQLPEFLDEFPKLAISNQKATKFKKIDWERVKKTIQIDKSVKTVEWLKPGEREARKHLNNFIKNKLEGYTEDRNDPNLDAQSGLSPYLHFGHIASQRVALELLHHEKKNIEDVLDSKKNGAKGAASGISAFLEELIFRKELSDNFCYYNKNYDNPKGFPAWATKTLRDHLGDAREYSYSLKVLETGETHDELWNAAQRQMVVSGKMHGYMRMYWAKKILEWSKSPTVAMKHAVYLNDKYSLDGRDPNGYAGIAWSIGGVHDRAWFPRKIFGKIRYMSEGGAKGKFDVKKYTELKQQ